MNAPRTWNYGDDEPDLPVIAVRDSNGDLWVRAHRRDMWTNARYLPDGGWASSACFWGLVTFEGSPVVEVPTNLPVPSPEETPR